jgi:hypothetical protein
LTTGYRDARGVPERLAAGVAAIGVDGPAQRENQLRGLPVIERQIVDALFVNDRRDRGFLGLHHAGGGADFHPLGGRADLHGDIHLDVVVDDKNEAGFDVVFKSRTFYFQAIGPYRKIGQNVSAVFIGDGCVGQLLVGFRHGNLGVGNGRTAGIDDDAADLGNCDGLAVGSRKTGKAEKDSRQNTALAEN